MVPGSIPGDRTFAEADVLVSRMRVSPHSQRPPTHASTQSGLCLHRGIAPQLAGRISATQLRLQASSAQQQYIAVLQSRFVRRRLHWWSPKHHKHSAKSVLVFARRLLLTVFLVFFFALSAYQASPPSFPPRFSNESCSAAGSPWIHQAA